MCNFLIRRFTPARRGPAPCSEEGGKCIRHPRVERSHALPKRGCQSGPTDSRHLHIPLNEVARNTQKLGARSHQCCHRGMLRLLFLLLFCRQKASTPITQVVCSNNEAHKFFFPFSVIKPEVAYFASRFRLELNPWEYIHSGHVALPAVLRKVHHRPQPLYGPSEVNSRQVDGLARIPTLMQALCKSHL